MSSETNEIPDSNILRVLRESRGFSQQEASDKVEVSRQTWSAWESLTRPIVIDQLAKIRKTLDLSTEETMSLIAWWRKTAPADVEPLNLSKIDQVQKTLHLDDDAVMRFLDGWPNESRA